MTGSWIIRIHPDSRQRAVEWLEDEGLTPINIDGDSTTLAVEFQEISEAFRFRMWFDEDLVEQD